MATLWVRRVGNVLHPDGDVSIGALSKLPFNKPLKAEIKAPRNGKHHRLYWELVNRIADAVGAEPDTVSDTLKIATNHCTIVKSKTYGVLRLPKSISFAALDQQAFSDFFERCLVVVKAEWGIDRPDILAALGDLLEPEKT